MKEELGLDANRIFETAVKDEFKTGRAGFSILNSLLVKINTEDQKQKSPDRATGDASS